MLYLIEAKAIDSAVAGPPEQVVPILENQVIPSYKTIIEGERSKKFTGGVLAGRRAWAIIGDFPTNDEAHKWVTSLPFWTIQEVEITAMVSFQSQLDAGTRIVQNMKSMLKR